MKKITTVLTAFIFFCACAFAQKKEKGGIKDFFAEYQIKSSFGKDNSAMKDGELELSGWGVVGPFYLQGVKVFPLQKATWQNNNKFTEISLGYGGKINLQKWRDDVPDENKLKLNFGFGPSVTWISQFMSYPKKFLYYYGGNLSATLENVSMRAELSANYSYLPPENNYSWSQNLFRGEFGYSYFFGKFGVGAMYKVRIFKSSEKFIQGQPFNAVVSSESKRFLTISPSLKIGDGQKDFILRVGITLKGKKYSYSQIGQQPNFSAPTDPPGFTIGATVNLRN